MLFLAINVSEAPGNGLKQCFCITHIVISCQCSLCRNVCQRNNRSPLSERVKFIRSLQYAVKTECRDIQCLEHVLVTDLCIGNSFTDVRGHANRVKHKVNPVSYTHLTL